jgi:hypothetical protein
MRGEFRWSEGDYLLRRNHPQKQEHQKTTVEAQKPGNQTRLHSIFCSATKW